MSGFKITEMKAVFFDIDGTLLPVETGIIPQSTLDSLKELKTKGIKIIVATGRNLSELKRLGIHSANFDAYITMNGQITYDKDFNIIDKHPFHQGELEILVHIFQAKKIPFEMFGEFSHYINYIDDNVISVREKTNGKVAEIGEYKGEEIYQINTFVSKEKIELLRSFLDDSTITTWNDQGFDIISKGGGKNAAIETFLAANNIGIEETMAFGDGENDISMLQFVGCGVAMGNAKDTVKEKATYVTDHILNDGIKKALQHFNLID